MPTRAVAELRALRLVGPSEVQEIEQRLSAASALDRRDVEIVSLQHENILLREHVEYLVELLRSTRAYHAGLVDTELAIMWEERNALLVEVAMLTDALHAERLPE